MKQREREGEAEEGIIDIRVWYGLEGITMPREMRGTRA